MTQLYKHIKTRDVFGPELLGYLTRTLNWTQDMYTFSPGIVRTSPRLISLMGDCSYSYSGIIRHGEPWDQVVRETIIPAIEHVTELPLQEYNGCLFNLYRTGMDSITMHSDDEKELDGKPIISLSLGTTRKFIIQNIESGKKDVLYLEHGDILIMKPELQQLYKHGIPKEPLIMDPRINLTFRNFR